MGGQDRDRAPEAVNRSGAPPRLMLVTDRRRLRRGDLLHVVERAVRGGVGFVQFRERDLGDDELYALVAAARERLPARTWIAVNDRETLARRLGVGLHLPEGRPAPGPGLPFWGRSVHTPQAARAAAAEGARYLVAGTIYATASKPGRTPAGLQALRAMVQAAGEVPVYAIGGILLPRVPEIVQAGAWGVAVCGAVQEARDPQRVAEAFALALEVAAAAP